MTEPLQIESPQANINRARFIGKDFFTFVDDLIARIQVQFVTEFNDFISSGVGVMLIDMVAWAGELLSFYIDRQASENYITTAKHRRSISRIARNVGYKMRAAVSASVDLSINLSEVKAFDVTIPIGFQFQGPNDLVFEALEAVTFPAGEGPSDTPRIVSVSEGTTVVQNFTSDGSKNQVFVLTPGQDKFVADGTAVGSVDGSPWTESEFITFDATDQFEVDYNAEPALWRFGDSAAGNIPASGASLTISYRSTSGAGGLVLANTITSVVTPLVVASESIPLTITHEDPSSGGADSETVDEARYQAPQWFAARNVAVTQADYVGLSQAYTDAIAGAVALSQAFVAHSAEDDLQLAEYLDATRLASGNVADDVNALVISAEGDLSTLSTARDNAETENNTLGTVLTTIDTSSGDARDAAVNVKNSTVRVESQITATETKIGSLPTASPSQLTAGDLAELQGYLTQASADNTSADGYADDVLAELDTIDGQVTSGNTAQAAAAGYLTSMSPLIVDIQSDLDSIETSVSTNFDAVINTQMDNIFNHVDSWLSANCNANLVQVPILGRDVDRFLVAPSQALIASLQSYLDERREVTQVVEVVSGEPYLVAAVIEGTIGVERGYVLATVVSQANAIIDDILRERTYDDDLYVSDIATSLAVDPRKGTGGIEGLKYANIAITGPAGFLDASGNLIVGEKYVITKGTVTITAVTVS